MQENLLSKITVKYIIYENSNLPNCRNGETAMVLTDARFYLVMISDTTHVLETEENDFNEKCSKKRALSNRH